MPSVSARRKPTTFSSSMATSARCERDTNSRNRAGSATRPSQPADCSSRRAASVSDGRISRISISGRDRMIIEVRTYRMKPGRRAEFIRLFETRSVPAMRGYGMHVVGPLLDVENPHRFVFLRSFPSLEEREPMKDAFYGSDLWKNELEAIMMPMIDSYDVTLCEVAPGCVFEIPR